MSTGLHTQKDGQTERMNPGMELYLHVVINHRLDNWVQWLPHAEFAANNGISESTQCPTLFVVQSANPRMLFVEEATQERDQRRLEADQVQSRMRQVHEHL
jgi:hypothetical protein